MVTGKARRKHTLCTTWLVFGRGHKVWRMSAQQSCGVDIRQRHDLDAEGLCKVWDMMIRCNHFCPKRGSRSS